MVSKIALKNISNVDISVGRGMVVKQQASISVFVGLTRGSVTKEHR